MSNSNPFLERLRGAYLRRASYAFFRNPILINPPRPLISFTFDDFPESAFREGGAILAEFGLSGTYYAALGIAGQDSVSGRIIGPSELAEVRQAGHELGCHTFGHCHSGLTSPRAYEKSVLENQAALEALLPGARFETFSYPISNPRPFTKYRASRHFVCCRGGGQTVNTGWVDRNLLSAFFLEKTRGRLAEVEAVIEHNRRVNGWLIFATHDIAEDPSPYGCTPQFLRDVVRLSVESGARILPVIQAIQSFSHPE